jgi:hypothetical protein
VPLLDGTEQSTEGEAGQDDGAREPDDALSTGQGGGDSRTSEHRHGAIDQVDRSDTAGCRQSRAAAAGHALLKEQHADGAQGNGHTKAGSEAGHCR